MLVRSDAPIALGENARDLLRSLGVVTALDLREPAERELDPADLADSPLRLAFQPILGGDFRLQPEMTLEEVYAQVLAERGDNLTEAVRLLARPESLPAIVFCSAGKDRTGLVTALLLGALGVSDDQIVADYTLTERNMNGAFRARVYRRAQAAGISEQELAVKLGAPPKLMWTTLAWLRSQYGGATGYLRAHGMTNAELEWLRVALVEPVAASAA
jgi:protein-tyrosine phosphatase